MTETTNPSPKAVVLWKPLMLLISLLGVAFILYYSRNGIGVRGDSVRYVMGANNILAGDGFVRTSGGGELYPETGFAPVLAYVLAGLGALGVDPYVGGRIMNALLFGANLYLAGFLILRSTRSFWAPLVGGIILLAADNLVEWHAWLMTEAPYISLSLIAMIFLVSFFDTGRRSRLVLGAIVAGIASLTRYVGLALAFAGGLSVLSLSPERWRRRMVDAVWFGILAVAPFALWMLRNQAVAGGSLANRELIFHPDPMRPDLVRLYLFEAATWILPRQVQLPRLARTLVAVCVTAVGPFTYFFRELKVRLKVEKPPRRAYGSLPWVLLFYLLGYLGILVANSVLLDAATTVSAPRRYLTPFFVALVILVVTTSHFLVERTLRGRSWARAAALGISIFLVLLNAQRSIDLARGSTLALGFTGIRESWPDVVAGLEALEPEKPIITNNPEMVYYLVDRPAYMMPIKFDPYKLAEREDFQEQVEATREKMKQGSTLVFFGELSKEDAEIIELLQVVPLHTFQEVTFYGYP